MCHELLSDVTFWLLLRKLDDDLAAETQASGCSCKGRLDRADYPRKPRGAPPRGLPADFHVRRSFCCAVDGCRRRRRPPSVLFFGRRVYLGAVVVLVATLRGGSSPRRIATLRTALGERLSPRTVERWRRWWRESFPATRFWKSARARFVPPPDPAALPASLLEHFRGRTDRERVRDLLVFLAPLFAPV